MKKRNYFLIALVAFLVLSCKKENQDYESVNKWIYSEMSIYYLWNENLPDRPNYTINPEDFFESILYMRNQPTGDRFSWIQNDYLELLNSLSGITQYDIGFEYLVYPMSETSNDVIAQIAYVKPNTDAATSGLKRGDFFTQVNGEQLNRDNWHTLLSGSETSVSITLFDIHSGITTNKTVKKMPNYAEDPLFYNNIYQINGKKVGYLVYNAFITGPTQTSNVYDKKLNDVFADFKNSGITELVLDLRYNSGGAMSSAILLGSMIAPNFSANNIFIKLGYNKLVESALVNQEGEEVLIDYMKDELSPGEPLNNVGSSINSLYILTSGWTASASELVINSLKPYMQGKPIILIGNTTVGKNVGSISRYEEDNPKNKWGIQPIICRFYNSDGTADFATGFEPDHKELDNGEKLPLGDVNEIMLKTALEHITTGSFSTKSSALRDADRITLGSSVEQKAWANKTIADKSFLKNVNFETLNKL